MKGPTPMKFRFFLFLMALASLLASLPAFAITATKEYVDRRDAATLASATAAVASATNTLWQSSAAAFMPQTNAYTKAETDERIIALAPAPGDYLNVSNRAVNALSRAEAEAGFTEWVVTPSEYDGKSLHIEWVRYEFDGMINQGWAIVDSDGEERAAMKDYPTATNLVWVATDTNIGAASATRTRLPTMADLDAKASTNDVQLTPIYSDTPTFSEWTSSDSLSHTIRWDGSRWEVVGEGWFDPPECYDFDATSISSQDLGFTAIRTRTDILGYRLGSQSDKPLQPQGDYARAGDIAVAATAATNYTDSATSNITAVVATWENFLDGSNVVFSITNYISGTYNLDAAKLRILELKDGEYHEVYNSRDEILTHIAYFKTNDFAVATNQVIGAVNAAIADKADRAWGKYSSSGQLLEEVSVSNTVYMTAPNTVFAGGLEYERVAVGEGSVCVLTTRGAPVWTLGDEGTFKFQDDGGTNYFGFAKTDSYTVGANTDGIAVSGGLVTLTYDITMSGRPCVWYASELSANTTWEQLNLSDGSAVPGATYTVAWESDPEPNTQVCYINVGSSPQGFFKATVEVAGSAKFMTNMAADLSGGILCTDGQHKVRPVYSNGSVTWEVMQ